MAVTTGQDAASDEAHASACAELAARRFEASVTQRRGRSASVRFEVVAKRDGCSVQVFAEARAFAVFVATDVTADQLVLQLKPRAYGWDDEDATLSTGDEAFDAAYAVVGAPSDTVGRVLLSGDR